MWSIVALLLTCAIIGFFVYSLYVPVIFKPLITSMLPSREYECNDNARHISDTCTLYSRARGEKLVVIFVGGSFIKSRLDTHYGLSNALNTQLGDGYDILIFSYPTRFQSFYSSPTIRDTMLYINGVLSAEYISKYSEYHAIGVSAGALLASAFIRKESDKQASREMSVPSIGLRFSTFVSVCGVLTTEFHVKTITKLFEYYIMRSTPGKGHYSAFNLDSSVRKLIISAYNDFLFAQSNKLVMREHATEKVFFQGPDLPHSFVQAHMLPESEAAIKRISDFIIHTLPT